MKTKSLLAPIALAATILVPGTLMAGPVNENASIVAFQAASQTLVGAEMDGDVVVGRLIPGQTIRGIIDPDILPAGVCRGLGIRWNIGVILDKREAYFDRILGQLRDNPQCLVTLGYDESNPNADGSYNIDYIAPSP